MLYLLDLGHNFEGPKKERKKPVSLVTVQNKEFSPSPETGNLRGDEENNELGGDNKAAREDQKTCAEASDSLGSICQS